VATVSERHAGGRPRVHEPSELFVRVERLARSRGLHLDELAAKAGISTPTLYQLRDPKVSTAKAIAAALGITIDRLIAPPRRSSRRASA
jgi:transcriptional regulator with XRE-family HTH domain